MWKSDIENTKSRYRLRWNQYGYDARTLGWNKGCQWVRFEAALRGNIAEECTSILDVGCGFGDLLSFLRSKGWHGRYCGIDLVPELVQEAAQRHAEDPAAEFECADICEWQSADKMDLAITVGMFNHKLQQSNLEFVCSVFENMWRASSRVVICDFLSTTAEPDRRQAHLCYYAPQEIYGIASRYSRRSIIDHSYMPFEFQLKVWHDDSYSTAVPVFQPFAHLATVLRPDSQ